MELGVAPRWFTLTRRIAIVCYVATILVCFAGGMLLPLVGGIGYGDWHSYRLYGSPWGDSHLPWYMIGSFRLMSLTLRLAIAGLVFAPTYVGLLAVLARLVRWRTSNAVALLRTGSAIISIALVVVVYGLYWGALRFA